MHVHLYECQLVGDLRMDFAIVVLGVHDNDEVCRDVDAPAERTRGHHHLNSTCKKEREKNEIPINIF